MKTVLLSLLVLLNINIMANISISLSPSFPTVDESFNVVFSIETSSNAEPFISFDPSGVEVIGRSSPMVSSQIQFINGRTTSKKTIIYNYEMKAPSARTAFLRNITVDIGSDTFNHKDVSIKVSKASKERGDTFVLAEVSNDNPFVGEGIDIRYYLYSRNRNLTGIEIKEFPKLNGFIKRFHKVNGKEEVVQYNGQVFRRYLKYSSRAFPEKTGELKIDPLKLTLRFRSGRNRIGSFGSLFGSVKERSKGSKTIKIKVRPLPATNVPKNFTGLVGEHSASFRMTRSKYLVNEPIEVRLEVAGVGALEKLEAPKIWTSPLLEDFDTKSEYIDIDSYKGRKVFDYTYLVRGNGKIDAFKKELFYFDPKSETYKDMSININELTLSGSLGSSSPSLDTENLDKKLIDKELSETSQSLAPLFAKISFLQKIITPKWILVFLGAVYLLLMIAFFILKYRFSIVRTDQELFLRKIYKEGINYKNLSDYILSLRSEGGHTDIKILIEESKVKKSDKEYFLNLIKTLEEEKFYDGLKDNKKLKIRKKPFEHLKLMNL